MVEASVAYREDPLTIGDYNMAIATLIDAKQQMTEKLIGRGASCCRICTDDDHTAETCRHNPLLLARKWAKATNVWKCWHCGYIATNDAEGRAHFGADDTEPAACQRKKEEGA